MKHTFFTFLALAMFVTAGMAHAQTTTDPTTAPAADTAPQDTAAQVTPGAPSAGAGGDAATNLAILLASGLAAVAGGIYLGRRFSQ